MEGRNLNCHEERKVESILLTLLAVIFIWWYLYDDITRRWLWPKSIKYPFLWVLMSHKIACLYVHNNSVHGDSITIVWLHLHGKLTGSFCNLIFQPHRPWKTWDYTAAVFFLDHLSFLLKERRLTIKFPSKGKEAVGGTMWIQVSSCYRAICPIADMQTTVCLGTRCRRQFILRTSSGQTFLNSHYQASQKCVIALSSCADLTE